jgi:DNA-binding protein HU-beta
MSTKADLVDKLADMAGMTKVDSAKALDTLADIVIASLKRGEKVTWTGFGTFEVRSRAARMGRNPQTGAPLHIAASKTPAFKAGKSMKDAVN